MWIAAAWALKAEGNWAWCGGEGTGDCDSGGILCVLMRRENTLLFLSAGGVSMHIERGSVPFCTAAWTRWVAQRSHLAMSPGWRFGGVSMRPSPPIRACREPWGKKRSTRRRRSVSSCWRSMALNPVRIAMVERSWETLESQPFLVLLTFAFRRSQDVYRSLRLPSSHIVRLMTSCRSGSKCLST